MTAEDDILTEHTDSATSQRAQSGATEDAEANADYGKFRNFLSKVPQNKRAIRWMLFVLALLVAIPLSQPPWQPVVRRAVSGSDTKEKEAEDYLYNDLTSLVYKNAIRKQLDATRNSTYSHLSDDRFESMCALVVEYSDCVVIDGAAPSTMSGYEFDIELKPGAVPTRHQLPRLSPEETKREQYHVRKAERLGHLRIPNDSQKSDWATRTHIVWKKDDVNGRWICDYRPLNAATVKRPTPIGDVATKARQLAAKRWKSALDAWSGFNQMKATERASRCLQILTSLGLRQYVVLPFGVTNGPPYFQEAMLDLYGGASRQLPSLLDSYQEGRWLGIFVDDVMLGTGDSHNLTYAVSQSGMSELDGFEEHHDALKQVLERARLGNLRFKLEKMNLFQLEVECLGMDAGLGVLKASPKKTSAIETWPRPQKPEDVESFLASMVFIREHLSPRFSHIAKPLRDLCKELQLSRKAGHKTRRKQKGREKPEELAEWPDFWHQEHEDAFQMLTQLARTAVELAVPDYQGLADGSNELHIWPDACAYGIGGGLFQASPPAERADQPVETHYSVLHVREWNTKQEISNAYQQRKRQLTRHEVNNSDLEKILLLMRFSPTPTNGPHMMNLLASLKSVETGVRYDRSDSSASRLMRIRRIGPRGSANFSRCSLRYNTSDT